MAWCVCLVETSDGPIVRASAIEGVIIHRPTAISTPDPRTRLWAGLLLATAVYYVACVLALATARRGESEPLVFARLLATGHMGTFLNLADARLPPADEWAQAKEWQRFERLEGRGVWRQIAEDSGRHEAHPPFFFWLMHAALLAGVDDHWVTTVINLPAVVGTGALVVGFAFYVSRDRTAACMAGVLWFLSPPVMVIGDAVRSPTLFAPLVLLLVWLTIDWARRPRGGGAWRSAATVVLCLLGMLNHFQMAIAIAACGLYLVCHLRWRAWPYALAVGVAAGLFLLAHPFALQSLAFNATANMTEPVTVRSIAVRFLNVGIGLLHFLAIEPKWTRALTLLIPLILLIKWLMKRRLLTDAVSDTQCPSSHAARLTLLLLTIDVAFYVTWRLPYHAYGAYYFPGLIVLTPVWLAVGVRRLINRDAFRLAVVGVLLVSSVAAVGRQFGIYRRAGEATDAIARAELIFSDAVNIRGIPRIVDPADPAAWVRTARRHELPALIDAALNEGRRVAVAPDASYDPAVRPDEFDAYLANAVAAGRLVWQGGLEPISPNFQLYRSP